MSKGPIRRSQLIAPFGVGAMVVVRDGISLISCGLDHWYKRESQNGNININEYEVEEWRLQRELKVSKFRLPPDFRRFRSGESTPNNDLKIPFLRFPLWHFCSTCHTLEELTSTVSQRFNPCSSCASKHKKNRNLVQVPFVAMCENGHIQDFPWKEWVHRSANPTCKGTMYLKTTGEAGLAGQEVSCSCGLDRNLGSITLGERGVDTYLTANLDDNNQRYSCQGLRPWLGMDGMQKCDAPLKGSLRAASNVYFAKQKSAIYLPRSNFEVVNEIVALMERPPISSFISILKSSNNLARLSVKDLRGTYQSLIEGYNETDINDALKIIYKDNTDNANTEVIVDGDDRETAFRRAEFNALRAAKEEQQLLIRKSDHASYDEDFRENFSNITLISKLRETRAFTGFTRIFSENAQTNEELRLNLWKKSPETSETWLPAYVVYGEGIFIELNYEKLNKWEKQPNVIKRLKPLIEKIDEFRSKNNLEKRILSPRFILIHTLAHILINRLVFECGYSSASLRERIFASSNEKEPMAGILIYTAAGDSEGTMGGLVRMGKHPYLEQVVRRAIEDASWCSVDPVCMELGEQGGQGPDSCNLAACHNCALLPETACEEFNKYLDRATLMGTIEDETIGYFSDTI